MSDSTLIQEIADLRAELKEAKATRDRHIGLENELSAKLAAALKEKDAWMESAAQFCRNADFYHGLVSGIGAQFGEVAYISDDGSRQQDVLALKVPELVKAALEANKTAEAKMRDAEKDRDAWKHDALMWSCAWERELDGYYFPKSHRIDAAVLSTQKLIARLKAVEAERDQVWKENKSLRGSR